MMIIAKEAEEKLWQDLCLYRHEQTQRRCFYMAFSKLDLPREVLFERFFTALQAVPHSYMAQVYICHDTDVFIVMTGFMQRQFAEMLNKVAMDMHTPEIMDIAMVYELGAHWNRLESLCRRKREALALIKADQEFAKRHENAERKAYDAIATMDVSMIASIGRRRSGRLETNILIVDDDQLIRTLAGNVLRENYTPFFAKDGKTALDMYVDGAPDVVFLDIGLPEIGGHEVLEAIMQIDPEAYVIMFSGHKDRQNMLRAMEAGSQGFLGKPFTREKLYHYVENAPHVITKKKRKRPQGSGQ